MSMRLPKDKADQLRSDLKRSPAEFGYGQSVWTAACLCRHLETCYAVKYAIRHCRRLLLKTKTQSSRQEPATAAGEPKLTVTRLPAWSGFSDRHRHNKILHRIRQISSSGLPLRQFAHLIFEQLTSATNSGDAMQMIEVGNPVDLKLIFRDQESIDWTAANLKALDLVNSDDSRISGMNVAYTELQFVQEPVLSTGRLVAPHFHASPAYNEVWKYHLVHSGAMTFFRDNGRHIGLAPIWKSRRERPFTADDLNFLHRAVPLITHALVTAQALTPPDLTISGTEANHRPVGIITADLRGRVLAMDHTARALFAQPAVFDGKTLDAFATSNLREGLRYVTQVIRNLFGTFAFASEDQAAVPAARIWWHAKGTVLLLKAVLSERATGEPLITIMVEERELAGMQQKRLALRHGMSERESQVFQLARVGTPRKEIAYQLGLSLNTVRTYVKQIGLKGLPIKDEPNSGS